MQNQVFQNIKHLLEEDHYLRGSDKLLIYRYWKEVDKIEDLNDGIEFMSNATHPETIRRTRQKIQELYPDLKPSKEIQFKRDKLEAGIRGQVMENKLQQITLPL